MTPVSLTFVIYESALAAPIGVLADCNRGLAQSSLGQPTDHR
jgi:hypothetical protein